jgi:hypothetical protein
MESPDTPYMKNMPSYLCLGNAQNNLGNIPKDLLCKIPLKTPARNKISSPIKAQAKCHLPKKIQAKNNPNVRRPGMIRAIRTSIATANPLFETDDSGFSLPLSS